MDYEIATLFGPNRLGPPSLFLELAERAYHRGSDTASISIRTNKSYHSEGKEYSTIRVSYSAYAKDCVQVLFARTILFDRYIEKPSEFPRDLVLRALDVGFRFKDFLDTMDEGFNEDLLLMRIF